MGRMKRSAVLRAMYRGHRLSPALLRFADEGMASVGEFFGFPRSEIVPSHPDRMLQLALAQPFSRLGLLTDTLAIGADGSGNTWLVAIAGARNTVYLHDHDTDALYAVADRLETFARFMSLMDRDEPPTRREQAWLQGKIRFVPELDMVLECKPPTGGPRVPAALARQLRAASDLLWFFSTLASTVALGESPPRRPRWPRPTATPGAVVAELLRAFVHGERALFDRLVARGGPPWLVATGRFLQRHHETTLLARGRVLVPAPPPPPSNEEIVQERVDAVLSRPDRADELDLNVLLDEWLKPRLHDEAAVQQVIGAIGKLVTREPGFITPIFRFARRIGKPHPRPTIAIYDAVLATAPPEDDADARDSWLLLLNDAINLTFASRDLATSERLCDFAAPYAAENPYIFHAVACTYVATGRLDEAARQVTLAVQHDYEHLDKMHSDDDLAPLRDRPEFAVLAAAVQRRPRK